MEKEEVLRLSREHAKSRGWEMKEPIAATLKTKFFSRRRVWHVRSNADKLGANVRIEIDDRDGKILGANFLPK